MIRSTTSLYVLALLLTPSCDNPDPVPDPDRSVDLAVLDQSVSDQASADQARQDLSSVDQQLADVTTADGPGGSCPGSLPSGTCSQATSPRTCWYGSDPRWFCRTSALCDLNGTWQIKESLSGCAGALPASCPEDPATAYEGCTTDGGVDPICVYSDQFCQCRFGGGPDPIWGCTHIPAGCPMLPPEEGDPCSGTADCNYYPCFKTAICDQGVWRWQLMAC